MDDKVNASSPAVRSSVTAWTRLLILPDKLAWKEIKRRSES